VTLNRRFGLYEPPAITVSRGVYAPRTGFLGKLGFSTVEAALIRKDFKAFTRRRELMFIFVVPIVVIISLMQSLSATSQAPAEVSLFLFALAFLMPGSIMAMSLGNIIIGEEGEAVWHIYSAPVSAKSLVKSKFFFMFFFSILVTIVTGIIGILAFHPSQNGILIALVESLLLVFALGTVSLTNGMKGADFTELPRPRMIRTMQALLNLVECTIVALVILIPFVPYMFASILFGSRQPAIDLYQAVLISAAIAVVVTFVAYKSALENARKFLAKAET
jgi:hypothetical protein